MNWWDRLNCHLGLHRWNPWQLILGSDPLHPRCSSTCKLCGKAATREIVIRYPFCGGDISDSILAQIALFLPKAPKKEK